jgi:hypothetical protein
MWRGTSGNGTNGADVAISRSTTNGDTWEAPVRPHAGFGHQLVPSIAAAGGHLSVAWYDSRSEPAFTAAGPVSGQCPSGATTGASCTGMDVFYNQANTAAAGPFVVRDRRARHKQVFNPNLFGSIKAVTPFIGDYITVVSKRQQCVRRLGRQPRHQPEREWPRKIASTATDPPALINGPIARLEYLLPEDRQMNRYLRRSPSGS